MFFCPSLHQFPEHLKIEGPGWFAIFNDAAPRALDVQLLHDLEPRGFGALCVQFSPDGGLLAAGCPGCVRLFDAASGRVVCDLEHEAGPREEHDDPANILCVCFLPTSKALVAAGEDGTIRQWDLESRSVLAAFSGHDAPVCSLALSKDGCLMLSGSKDGTLRLWDVPSEQQIKAITLDGPVQDLSLSADGAFVAVGIRHHVQVFGCPDGRLAEKLDGSDGHEEDVFAVAFSPRANQLASVSLDKTARLWEVGQQNQAESPVKPRHIFEGHQDLALCVCWSPDARWVMSGSKDMGVQIWDPKSGQAQVAIAAHRNSVLSISSSPDGRLFATGGGDSSVRIWSYSPHVATDAEKSRAQGKVTLRNSLNLGKPGSGLALGFLPPPERRFPVLMGDQERDWTAATLLIREACMLKMIEDLTNKPRWWLKARDREVTTKWKQEAMAMNWAAYRSYGDFTPAMADACIEELRIKAGLYERTGLVPVFDYSACVIKSDDVASDLIKELSEAVLPLEDVPEERKDWHPGSAGKVLDLVHPSLWPLQYGRTRLTKDRIPLQGCLDSCGLGEALDKPDPSEQVFKSDWLGKGVEIPSLSLRFQWLPCDVCVDSYGHTMIDSYINNLHPTDHGQLYRVINGFIEKSLPAWDVIYRWPTKFRFQRLRTARAGPICTARDICEDEYECDPWNRPIGGDEPEREEDEHCEEGYENSVRGKLDSQWFDATHPPDVPDAVSGSQQTPEEDESPRSFCLRPEHVRKSGFFDGASRIQVIVKLANIYLTPKEPNYDGGSWHIEGQLNEHICATALFYYDNENITDSRLAFRALSNREELQCSGLDYRQCDYRSISRTFAVNAEPGKDSTLQDLGSTLTSQGRALFFPNLLQHRVQPFSLADRSRPGHRKVLALFLVDPAIPIISTANVPPQQPHWSAGRETQGTADCTISEAEAKSIREELMAERSALQRKTTEKLESVDFNFCEH